MKSWPVRLGLMVAFCGTGLLLIAFHFDWLPWPRPQVCRAMICEPARWQLLALGIGFVLLGVHLLIPRRLSRVSGMAVLLATGALLTGVFGLLASAS